MAVTLVQAALLSQNDLQRGVVETFIQESKVLDRIPLLPVQGNAYAYNEEATLPGVEFRAVNSPYSESTGTVVQRTEALVILGGIADVDTYIVQTRGNLNDQRVIQTRLKVKAVSYKFQDAFINGDTAVDANSFDGLKKRLTGAQVIDAATNGLAVLGADDAARQTFLDQLAALIAAVPGGPDALYMNASIRSKLLSSLRRLNIYTQPVGEKRESSYDNIPIIDIGNKADGTPIIPQTETQGASSVASSIYAVKWSGDESENGVAAATNGGVQARDLGRIPSPPAWRTEVEFFTGLAVFGKGAARLRGVLNS
jgi:hypothetical protein